MGDTIANIIMILSLLQQSGVIKEEKRPVPHPSVLNVAVCSQPMPNQTQSNLRTPSKENEAKKESSIQTYQTHFNSAQRTITQFQGTRLSTVGSNIDFENSKLRFKGGSFNGVYRGAISLPGEHVIFTGGVTFGEQFNERNNLDFRHFILKHVNWIKLSKKKNTTKNFTLFPVLSNKSVVEVSGNQFGESAQMSSSIESGLGLRKKSNRRKPGFSLLMTGGASVEVTPVGQPRAVPSLTGWVGSSF